MGFSMKSYTYVYFRHLVTFVFERLITIRLLLLVLDLLLLTHK